MWTTRRRVACVLTGATAVALLMGCARDPEPRREAGPHQGASCADCHGDPSGASIVSASSCRTCHESLADRVELAGVRFSHEVHGDRDARQLVSCTACHLHDHGDEDLRVDAGSCFLCHAELPRDGEVVARLPESGCLDCHGQPTQRAFTNTGLPVDHATVVERGISCVQCHFDLVEGSGMVDESTCRACHAAVGASPLEGNEPRAASIVHDQHFASDFDPACRRCHDSVRHAVGEVASSLVLVCQSCHTTGDPALTPPIDSRAHRSTQLLYTGLGEEPIEPAVKFVERIACQGCHSRDSMGQSRGSEARLRSMAAECASCHGEEQPGLLAGWVRGMRDRTEAVGRYARDASSDDRIRRSDAARPRAEAAVQICEFVETADGVHNIPGADALLRRAIEEASAAFRVVDLAPPPIPNLGPSVAENPCARCHYGVEHVRASFQGEAFDHGLHVLDQGIACETCHSSESLVTLNGRASTSGHGLTHVTKTDCLGCHHAAAVVSTEGGAAGCAACHGSPSLASSSAATLTVGVGKGAPRPREVPWTHARHASLECAACHVESVSLRPPPEVVTCTACHDDHHAPERTCAACHGGADLLEAHSGAADPHVACDTCHPAATVVRLSPRGSFCATCHAGNWSDHYAESGEACTQCHFLQAPDQFRAHLSSSDR